MLSERPAGALCRRGPAGRRAPGLFPARRSGIALSRIKGLAAHSLFPHVGIALIALGTLRSTRLLTPPATEIPRWLGRRARLPTVREPFSSHQSLVPCPASGLVSIPGHSQKPLDWSERRAPGPFPLPASGKAAFIASRALRLVRSLASPASETLQLVRVSNTRPRPPPAREQESHFSSIKGIVARKTAAPETALIA